MFCNHKRQSPLINPEVENNLEWHMWNCPVPDKVLSLGHGLYGLVISGLSINETFFNTHLPIKARKQNGRQPTLGKG